MNFRCLNNDGGFTCVCGEGLVGDPTSGGCRKPGDCFADADCPSSATCLDNFCKNPCEVPNACGQNAECLPIAHAAQCVCPPKTREDINHNCIPVECIENNDCNQEKTCVDSNCVNPCSLANACGAKAECKALNHIGVCSCQPGTTGDPHLGCVAVQYCAVDNQCPSGSKCYNGICTSLCLSTRECIADQLCIQGICTPTCKSNDTCPDFQFCQNNICSQEFKCRANDDCSFDKKCASNSVGQNECLDVCEAVLCGRNAECVAKNHQATCICKIGYKGNPNESCQKVECETDNQCSNDKLCDNYMCKIACLAKNPCGKNALCSAEHHKQVCYCQPGYTGNPNTSCKLIDFCADNPCGPRSKCINSRGSFKCLCPQGLIGDPYNEGCRTPLECQNHQDCSHIAKCDKLTNKCVDVCDIGTCGPNAECIAVEHTGHCSCKNGYQGNPTDLTIGCTPKPVSCRETSDCPANTYCYGDLCRRK